MSTKSLRSWCSLSLACQQVSFAHKLTKRVRYRFLATRTDVLGSLTLAFTPDERHGMGWHGFIQAGGDSRSIFRETQTGQPRQQATKHGGVGMDTAITKYEAQMILRWAWVTRKRTNFVSHDEWLLFTKLLGISHSSREINNIVYEQEAFND